LLAAGLLAAALCALAGAGLEVWWFGANTDGASRRAEAHVQREFARMTAVLSRVAAQVAADPGSARALVAGADLQRELFDVLDRPTETAADPDQLAVTIYDARGQARAWTGRPSDIRAATAAEFFVTPSPLGLRLVHAAPIVGPDGARAGTVAAEHVLSPAPAASRLTATDWVLATPLGPASLRMRYEGAGDQPRAGAFVVRSPSGEPIVEVSIRRDDLDRARSAWRHDVMAAVITLFGVTLFLLVGPLLDRRAMARRTGDVLGVTAAAVALVLGGSAALLGALALHADGSPGSPVMLLLGGCTAAAVAGLVAGPILRLRTTYRGRRRVPASARAGFVRIQLFAGAAVTGTFVLFVQLVGRGIDPSSIDLRHFSLHPWSMMRLAILVGILAAQVTAVWVATMTFTSALARWRLPSAGLWRVAVLGAWFAPPVGLIALAQARGWAIPPTGLLLSVLVCGVAALYSRRVVAWYRHATIAGRILALFVAFLAPALLLYPTVNFFAEAAMRGLIVTRYAVEAQNHVQALQDRMSEAQREIDAMPILADLVATEGPPLAAPRTDSAFVVWSQTALARARLTSAIELYDRSDALVSRFALNFPEYTGTMQAPPAATGCTWDKFGEVAPFGSEERRMLHAQRQICISGGPGEPGHPVGTIVVHVGFDYRTLPFITSQSPYFEVFRPAGGNAPREGATGSDVDVVIYGWGLGPIYTSRRVAWPITDDLFAKIYVPTRAPFWATIRRGSDRYEVHFSNDRQFIYAIGYPALSVFDHLVHLAELTTMSGAAYVLVLLGTALFTRVARERSRVGRALLREIRASFYRKLFLAFVLASIIPVLTLALVIRAYVATQLRADVEAEATRTTAVAQRVIEQSDALQRRTVDAIAPVSDDVLVWISQVIDQDVNIFDGAQLVATSERDLFESGLLPTRTPDEVYRAIALQRLPSFVGEDQIGTVPYIVAAAPVRAGGRNAILTVPLANRQRDIEREIDDLDRGVHLASLFFILLGAAIGLSMAERIADPVRRLTRATRRIAHGDFDAHIAVRSADELRRLVDAFNSMAGELKAQRAQLERTHRLEAWAEMARQVAHEIKNPLTPIQLSAEHLQRVHADRGEPMGPVLESCVSSILGQVKLLRQLSAEFSSFASSPTARPARVDIPELVAEVVDPYRTGLAGRIELRNEVRPPLPRVFVDRTLVARALANIVENALHAMPGQGSITLTASADAEFVTIRATDAGAGMDEEALARVFEPYFSTKTTGTGLGLPIARRNIELNGGSIDVESARGHGTTVILRLPVAG
jgi:signal transduction histidine kinase